MHSDSNLTTREAANRLWNNCFVDSEAFTTFYFNRRYSDNIHMAIYHNKQMIAGLQMIPYPFYWKGNSMKASYISGACTDPSFRKQGVMHKLIEKTHKQMYKEGVALSTLIPAEPWLFNYYEKFGYQSLFKYQKTNVAATSLTDAPNITIQRVESLTTEQYLYADNAMRSRNCSILHTEKDIADVIDALQLDKGAIIVAKYAEKLGGIAFVENQEGTIIVKELLSHLQQNIAELAVNPNAHAEGIQMEFKELEASLCEVTNALLSSACTLFQVEELIWYKPTAKSQLYLNATNDSKKDSYSANQISQNSTNIEAKLEEQMGIYTLGMARIINLEQLLKNFAKINPLLHAYLYLEGDDTLPNNNGYYTLSNGICKRGKQEHVTYQKHNLTSLTHFIFASESPYMSLMID